MEINTISTTTVSITNEVEIKLTKDEVYHLKDAIALYAKENISVRFVALTIVCNIYYNTILNSTMLSVKTYLELDIIIKALEKYIKVLDKVAEHPEDFEEDNFTVSNLLKQFIEICFKVKYLNETHANLCEELKFAYNIT
jgi:hypothetical protein